VAPESGPPRELRLIRLRTVGVIALVLIVGLVLGRSGGDRPATAIRRAGGPVAAPLVASSSAWFCAGATDSPEGLAPGQLVISNAGPRAVAASVTVLASAGASEHRAIVVGPYERQSIPETVAQTAPWTGAIVDLDGGDVTVEQQITGPLGTTVSPCATDGSTSWYFASGATLVNATSEIILLNPYPTAAIANLTFTTTDGVEAPPQFEGVIVPAGRLVAIDLGSRLRRRAAIATSVAVTSGRVVAWKTDIVSRPLFGTPLIGTGAATTAEADPALPVAGVTATLGAPALAVRWRWPEGSTAAAVGERYVIYNPGSQPARLELSIQDGSAAAPAPLGVTVGPQATATLDPAAAGIAANAGYTATLTSLNGVPVVAERTVTAATASGRGVGEMLGSVQTAPDWLVGIGAMARPTDEVIAVSDPGPRALTVRFRALRGGVLAPVDGTLGSSGPAGPLAPVRVAAGEWVAVHVGAAGAPPDTSILVDASGPVIVERDLYGRQGTPGVSIALGVPLSS
jgi:hypothetical protein